MAEETLRVARLAVTGPSRAVAGHVAFVVQDALRTASRPVLGGRVLLVRRLDLGPLPPEPSRTKLSARITAFLRDLVPRAVPADNPVAVAAEAVWFADVVAAHAAMLRGVRAGRALTGWHWRQIAPGWTPGAPPDHQVSAVLAAVVASALAEQTPPLLALARVVREVVAADGVLAWLPFLELLSGHAAVPRAWFEAAPATTAPVALPTPPPEVSTILAALTTAMAPSGAWVRLLALVEVARAPHRLDDPGVLVEAHTRVYEARKVAAWRPAPMQGDRPAPGSSAPSPFEVQSAPPATPPRSPAIGAQTSSDPPSPPTRPARWWVDEPVAPTAPPPPVETSHGGVPFLIPILQKLGLDAVHRDEPWLRAALGLRILDRAMTDAAADDPLRPALTPDRPVWPWPEGFAAPAAWSPLLEDDAPVTVVDGVTRRGAVIVALPAGGDAAVPDPADAWLTAVDAWCQRWLRDPWTSVVHRSAAVHVTRTHVDLVFGHDQVEVELRRHGVDADPGWVWWWGRVVRYHYVEDRRSFSIGRP